MTSRDELAALAKSGTEFGQRTAGQLAVSRWGADASDAVKDSLAQVTGLMSWVFFGQRRDNRPEAIFWHNFRVGEDIYQRNAADPQRHLKTFIAVAHDICEDSRKFRPNNQVQPEDVAKLWRGPEADKRLIIDVLHLKTDAAGLEGDARRAKQHERVGESAAGTHGRAGQIYAEIMAADKTDNIRSDYEDMLAGRIKFATREKGLEYTFKKIADAQIVQQLPVPAEAKSEFRTLYEGVMQRVILDRLIPTEGAAVPGGDERLHLQMQRAQQAALKPTLKANEALYQKLAAQNKIRSMRSDLDKLRSGRYKFKTRVYGLEYAFAQTADALTVRAAPINDRYKKGVDCVYDKIMTELLYAGSITPTLIAPQNGQEKRVPVKSRRPARAARLSALTRYR